MLNNKESLFTTRNRVKLFYNDKSQPGTDFSQAASRARRVNCTGLMGAELRAGKQTAAVA